MAASDAKARSSLYVGDLHPDVTEKDLIEIFSRVCPLSSVHLCRDKFSHNCKSLCYGYVNFWHPCHAATALERLNHSPLKGKAIRIMWRERDPSARKNNNGNLFVKNLDKSISSGRLQEVFSKYGTILSCKVSEENGISKGFGFVQFESEDSAIAACSALHDSFLEGKKLYVSKLIRKNERNGAEAGFKNLFVKYLDEDITEDVLKGKFSEYGNIYSAVIMKDDKGKSKGFGFVNFDSHEAAKRAMEALDGELLGSKNIFVGRAVKKSEPRNNCRKLPGHTYHESVPEKMLEDVSGYGTVNSGGHSEGKTVNTAVAKPCVKSLPQPLYAYNCQGGCNFPYYQKPSPWEPTVYQYFAGSSNPPYSIIAQNIQRTFNALHIGLAAPNGYKQERYLEMAKDQKPYSPVRLSNNRHVKELSKESCTTKTFRIRQGSMLQPQVKNLQLRSDSPRVLKSPNVAGSPH